MGTEGTLRNKSSASSWKGFLLTSRKRADGQSRGPRPAERPREPGKMARLKAIAWSPWRPILALASSPVHLCEGGVSARTPRGPLH